MNYEMTPEVQAKVRERQAAEHGKVAMDFAAMETIATALFEENIALQERNTFFAQVNSDLMAQVDALRAERNELSAMVKASHASAPAIKAKKVRA